MKFFSFVFGLLALTDLISEFFLINLFELSVSQEDDRSLEIPITLYIFYN